MHRYIHVAPRASSAVRVPSSLKYTCACANKQSQEQCGTFDGKNSTLHRENDALQLKHDALKDEIVKKGKVIAAVLGLLALLAVLGMIFIIPQAFMSIIIGCVAGLLVRMHPTLIEMYYTQESVVNMIVMSTSALVCVIATCAFAVLLPFLGSCALGACVAYATYVFMTI